MSPGTAVIYPLLSVVPLPAASSGSEIVALGVQIPTGFSLKFVPGSLNVTTDQTQLAYAQLTINSTQSVTPGVYNFTVGAYYGQSSTTASLRVRVVNYLVIVPNNLDEFDPSNLTVKVGSTVYWINTDLNNMCDVVFTSGTSAQSPEIGPYATYSYTFTAPGTYSYHSTSALGMVGTITVTA
jgi:plastocyanin